MTSPPRGAAEPREITPDPRAFGGAEGRYRARDLLLLPGLVSLCRLPLGLAFVVLVNRPVAATVVLVAAAATDVLDGALARRLGLATPTGALLDAVTDKAFVLAAVGALVVVGALRPLDLLRLAVRDLAEVPLAIGFATRAPSRREPAPRSNRPGKLATVLQFVAITAAVHRSPWLDSLLWAAAIGGMLAALGYWRRALRASRLGAHGRSESPWRGA